MSDTQKNDEETPPELLASKLIDAWVADKDKKIPWAKAVQIVAIVTKQTDMERDRLLRMGDEDGSCEMCGRNSVDLERELQTAQATLAQVHLDKAEYDALKTKLAVCVQGQRAQEGLTKGVEAERDKLKQRVNDFTNGLRVANQYWLEAKERAQKAEARLARYEQAAEGLPEERWVTLSREQENLLVVERKDYDNLRDAFAACRVGRDEALSDLRDYAEHIKKTRTELAACRAELAAARAQEREECAMICDELPRACGGSRTDGDRSLWAVPSNHSDAHDDCHEALRLGAAIRARHNAPEPIAAGQESTDPKATDCGRSGSPVPAAPNMQAIYMQSAGATGPDAPEPNAAVSTFEHSTREEWFSDIGKPREHQNVASPHLSDIEHPLQYANADAPAAPNGYAHVPMGPVGATYPDKLDQRQGPYRRRKDVTTPYRRRVGKLSRRVVP